MFLTGKCSVKNFFIYILAEKRKYFFNFWVPASAGITESNKKFDLRIQGGYISEDVVIQEKSN